MARGVCNDDGVIQRYVIEPVLCEASNRIADEGDAVEAKVFCISLCRGYGIAPAFYANYVFEAVRGCRKRKNAYTAVEV